MGLNGSWCTCQTANVTYFRGLQHVRISQKHGRRPKDLLALRTGLMHLLWKMGNNHLNYYLRPTSKCRSSKHVSNLKGQSYINNPINLPSVEEDHQMLQSRQLYVVNYFGVRWLSKHFFKVQFKRPYHVNPPWMRALHCTPWSVIITLAGRYYSVNWYLHIFHDKTILQRWILDFSTVNMRPGAYWIQYQPPQYCQYAPVSISALVYYNVNITPLASGRWKYAARGPHYVALGPQDAALGPRAPLYGPLAASWGPLAT